MQPISLPRVCVSLPAAWLGALSLISLGACAENRQSSTATTQSQAVDAGRTTSRPTTTSPETAALAPGLPVGAAAPDALVTGTDGKPVHLASLYKDGPIVLTFYRGGWCPFCNRALAAWGPKIDQLRAAGGTFIALTPEKPELATATREKAHADYRVFSDTTQAAARAFNVHFVVDDATREKYRGYGLQVGEANASGTWELPAPATFVIDKGGIVRWVFADWDYKKRADPDDVIGAVKAITGGR